MLKVETKVWLFSRKITKQKNQARSWGGKKPCTLCSQVFLPKILNWYDFMLHVDFANCLIRPYCRRRTENVLLIHVHCYSAKATRSTGFRALCFEQVGSTDVSFRLPTVNLELKLNAYCEWRLACVTRLLRLLNRLSCSCSRAFS